MTGCVVAAVALMLAAEPQCPTDPASCRAAHGIHDLSYSDEQAACNTTTFMLYDYCYVMCPMRLVITDPPELRTWMCAIDNTFEPYAPEAHIDLHHPLNNQELELEAVGHPDAGSTRLGCDTADYAWGNKTVAGKIAMVRRGECNYDTKARQAHAAQAAMLFVVDYWPYYTSERPITGSTAGIETFPSLFAARHEADYILAALDRGVKVKGKFRYQCDSMPEGYLDNPQDYPWDACGSSRAALKDTCLKVGAPEPLCEVCTVELQLPGAEKLCLFGNNLRPRKKETLIHFMWDMPYTAQTDEVVYATDLANKGCSVSDYAGLAGKILLMPETGRCTLVMTVRNAQAAGVRAYILVTSTYFLQWYKIRAYSHHVNIPVHTVDYHAALKLQAFISNGGGRHIPGSGYALDAISFTRGEPPLTDPPTPAPLPPVVPDHRPQLVTSPDFEMSVGTVACVIVVCVDLVAIAVLFMYQRRDAVQLPGEVRAKTFSIPLKVANMGLSLTLLLLIAIVTFSLTRAAGQESTNRAMGNGRDALFLAYDSSEKNAMDLANTIRGNVINSVLVLLQKEIFHMEYKHKVVQDLFFGFNGSWDQFDARFVTFMRLQRNVDDSRESVRLAVFTTRGFFMNIFYKTDDRPDELRKDGVVGSVAQTQEGWRYGVNTMIENYITREFHYGVTIPPYQENASRMLGGNIGDPVGLTADQPLGHSTWMAGRLTFPLTMLSYHPISVYRPLYGGEGQYHGTIEVMSELSAFISHALQPSLQSSAATSLRALSSGIMQNMSVLVVDVTDKAILGSDNAGAGTSKREGVAIMDSVRSLYGLYYMHSHPTIRVAAVANYLDTAEGWTHHEGEFD